MNWATASNLRQHVHKPTERRGDKESTLDLIFTNTLSEFTHDHLHHAKLGSDHDMISGTLPARIPGNHVNRTPD